MTANFWIQFSITCTNISLILGMFYMKRINDKQEKLEFLVEMVGREHFNIHKCAHEIYLSEAIKNENRGMVACKHCGDIVFFLDDEVTQQS